MTPSLDDLMEKALDLGLQSAIDSYHAAALFAKADRTPEENRLIAYSDQSMSAYKACLQEIEALDPDRYPELRKQITTTVRLAMKRTPGMRRWRCTVCDFVYDEREGLPEAGFPPGTPFDDFPDDWVCPDCGVGKAGFSLIEG